MEDSWNGIVTVLLQHRLIITFSNWLIKTLPFTKWIPWDNRSTAGSSRKRSERFSQRNGFDYFGKHLWPLPGRRLAGPGCRKNLREAFLAPKKARPFFTRLRNTQRIRKEARLKKSATRRASFLNFVFFLMIPRHTLRKSKSFLRIQKPSGEQTDEPS